MPPCAMLVDRHHDGRLCVGQIVTDRPAPKEPEEAPLRELRRPRQAPVDRVDEARDAPHELLQHRVGNVRPADIERRRREGFDQGRSIGGDLVRLLAVHLGDAAQDVDEGRPAPLAALREIRAAPERPRVAVEEHGERPAALLPQAMERAHVDRVDVGALLAVDLDVDEEIVHHRRSRLVLEAFVRHHMAPVAGGIADRQQNGLAGRLGLGDGLGAPRAPVDRVVLMLQ